MITSFADILRDLQLKEQAILSAQAISHGPTIGNMYEGLTRDLLSRAIPATAGLRLVDGFVVGHDKTLSPQIDCMLVQGEGEQIPHTNHYKWPVKDVVAVFEAKKSLYGAQLQDSHKKLRAGHHPPLGCEKADGSLNSTSPVNGGLSIEGPLFFDPSQPQLRGNCAPRDNLLPPPPRG